MCFVDYFIATNHKASSSGFHEKSIDTHAVRATCTLKLLFMYAKYHRVFGKTKWMYFLQMSSTTLHSNCFKDAKVSFNRLNSITPFLAIQVCTHDFGKFNTTFLMCGCQSWPIQQGRLARWIKWKACDVGEAKEGIENELWCRWSNGKIGEWS